MTKTTPRNLAWLDRLTMTIPGYGGYHSRDRRRQAAFALRDAIVRRLQHLRADICQAIHDCVHREALSEIPALERIDLHIDRILKRLEHVGYRVESFYGGPDLAPHEVDPIYKLDHEIIETADHLATHFAKPDLSHDRLAEIQEHLRHLEHQMDERVQLLQNL